MKIALINGSPKVKESASATLLNDFSDLLPKDVKIYELKMFRPFLKEEEIKNLEMCPIWVFAFPLYVDGVPSHVLSCLYQLEQARIGHPGIKVYPIINCGFYEGCQTRHAMETLEIWCQKAGLSWGMGVGFGGGGALRGLKKIPLGKGPKKSLGKALEVLVNAIGKAHPAENIYTSISFPRFLYKGMAELHWKRRLKANGGKVKDLNKQIRTQG